MKLSAALIAAFFLQAESFVPRHIPSSISRSESALNVATNYGTTNGDQSINSYFGAPKQETTVAAVPKVAQRWRKSTKQLVTLGPASSTREMIEKLFLAGADCFRLNFSHGSQEQKKELLMTIREIEEKYAHPICILGDLQGPKLRVGLFYSNGYPCCENITNNACASFIVVVLGGRVLKPWW